MCIFEKYTDVNDLGKMLNKNICKHDKGLIED